MEIPKTVRQYEVNMPSETKKKGLGGLERQRRGMHFMGQVFGNETFFVQVGHSDKICLW